MKSQRKLGVYNLLKGIETGDPESVKVVNEAKYIQHNPQTKEGGEGLAQLFARLAKTHPKVEIVRLFEDDDYVFGHTIYDFSRVRVGFEVFRFEGSQVVEHWDNIQPRNGDMVSGPTEIKDLEATEENRQIIRSFLENVFVSKTPDALTDSIHRDNFTEHSTFMGLQEKCVNLDYKIIHRVLAEGNFVLSVSEGQYQGTQTSFYDLFRIAAGKIVDHWDTTEKVPPRSEWMNDNGKF